MKLLKNEQSQRKILLEEEKCEKIIYKQYHIIRNI